MPIIRGNGIYQPCMNEALNLLNQKKWVHIFSEGRVNQSGQLLRFKWGVARLIMECKEPPLILPFYHLGMADVVPLHSWYKGPRVGKKVVVAFGEPIDCSKSWIQSGLQVQEQRIEMTRLIQDRVQALKDSVDEQYLLKKVNDSWSF